MKEIFKYQLERFLGYTLTKEEFEINSTFKQLHFNCKKENQLKEEIK